MRPRRLPVIPTLVAAYRDWGGMLISMRAIILSAILIITAISVGEELVPRKLWEQQLSGEALGIVKDAIWAFLLAPVVLALHRFVILGEITPVYASDRRTGFSYLFRLAVCAEGLHRAAFRLTWRAASAQLVAVGEHAGFRSRTRCSNFSVAPVVRTAPCTCCRGARRDAFKGASRHKWRGTANPCAFFAGAAAVACR